MVLQATQAVEAGLGAGAQDETSFLEVSGVRTLGKQVSHGSHHCSLVVVVFIQQEVEKEQGWE